MEARSVAAWVALRVGQEVRGRLTAAAKLLERKIKEVLNVQAPRKKVISNLGQIYYRATTPAVRGAPPRKVTGLGRLGLTVKAEMGAVLVAFNAARSKTGFPYMDFHEGVNKVGLHPFILPTFKKVKAELERVAGIKLKDMKVKTTGPARRQVRNTGQEVS